MHVEEVALGVRGRSGGAEVAALRVVREGDLGFYGEFFRRKGLFAVLEVSSVIYFSYREG